MQNPDRWRPTTLVTHGGRLRASRDRSQVSVGSRLAADLVAAIYSERLPQFAKGRLLDLGCGQVPYYGVYKPYVSDCVCVDWEKAGHDSQHVDIACDLTRPLPFEAASFDTILLSDVLEHIPTPDALWAEMARVLRPQGCVLMNVPFFYWLHEQPHDYHRYTEFALRRFVGEAGLRLIELRATGGSPEVFADFLAKHFSALPAVGAGLAVVVQALAGAFVRTRPGRKISQRTAARFPLGYFLVAEKL